MQQSNTSFCYIYLSDGNQFSKDGTPSLLLSKANKQKPKKIFKNKGKLQGIYRQWEKSDVEANRYKNNFSTWGGHFFFP